MSRKRSSSPRSEGYHEKSRTTALPTTLLPPRPRLSHRRKGRGKNDPPRQLVRFRVRFSHSSHWLCSHPNLACLTSLSPASVSHQHTFRAACLISLYYPQVALACLRSSHSVVISQSLHNSEPCLDVLRCLLIPCNRVLQ
jgi:hypothetical protein